MTPNPNAAGQGVSRTPRTWRSLAWLFLGLAVSFLAAPTATARPDDDDDDADEVKPAAPAQHVFQEADFDRWVFQNNNEGPAGVRKRLMTMLGLHIDDIDRTCKLTEEQKTRIELAGRGDIKQFHALYEKVRQKFLKVRHDQQKMNDLWQEINPLRATVQHVIFNDDSFLFRSLHNILTAEQFAQFDASAGARRAYRQRARVELAVAMLEQNAPLTDAQRTALIEALTKLTKPGRQPGIYGYYVLMYQLAQLPEEKLKPYFDDLQWKPVSMQLRQFKGWKQWLRQAGALPEDDEEADNNDAKPAAGRG
jgi:hypothetical protein